MRRMASTLVWAALLMSSTPHEGVMEEVRLEWDARGQPESALRSVGPPPAASDSLRLQAVARALADDSGSPAVAVVLVEGNRVSVAAWGERSGDGRDPVEPGDAWHLGSNTKAMTAVLAARLVEAGLLRWDTTIHDVLGGVLAGARGEGLAEEGELGAAFREVTLAELLSHRSGLEANLPPALTLGLAGLDSLRDVRADRVRYSAAVLGMPPAAERGEFLYSNAGYVVAGAMMEAVADESWEALLRRHVWEPLGVEGGGFGPPERVLGHRGTPDGGLAPIPPGAFADNIPAMGPGARAHLTPGGYGQFLAAVLAGARGEGDPGFLPPESWEVLLAPGAPAPPAYALGWGLLQPTGEGERPALQHAGSNTLWFTLARVDAARNRAVAILLNDGRLELVSPLAAQALEQLLEASPPPEPADAPSTAVADESNVLSSDQQAVEPRGPTRVVASMDEVRVTFPLAAGQDWSPPADGPCESAPSGTRYGYSWGIRIPEARIGFSFLGATVSLPCDGPDPASLEALIEGAQAGVASTGMFLQFGPTPVDAFVEDGSVVLLLRDSAAIVDLFGLRPDSVSATGWSSPAEKSRWNDTIVVEYTPPSLPALDSAFLAESRAMRQAFEISIRRTSRAVEGVDSSWRPLSNPLWIAVGDSIHVGVQERRCRYDSCRGLELEVPDSAWSVDDPAVAILGIMDPRPMLTAYALGEVGTMAPVFLKAVAPGRTRVRVSDISPQDDESPFWMGAPTTVEADVVVTERPARLELLPRITSATLGDQVVIRAVATDVQGNTIVGATVRLDAHIGGRFTWIAPRDGVAEVTFDRPGVWTFTATLGPLSDSVQVTVGPGGT